MLSWALVHEERPVEEQIEVGARRMTVVDWEAEVMVRVVAWIAIVRGLELAVAYVPFFVSMGQGTPTSTSFLLHAMFKLSGWFAVGVVVWAIALVWSGALLFRRSAHGRNIVLLLTVVGLINQLWWGTIPSLGRLGRPSGLGIRFLSDPTYAAIVATMTLVSLFTLHALLHLPGRAVFAPEHQAGALAPLSTVWRLRRSLRGWIALGFLLGTLALAARTVVTQLS